MAENQELTGFDGIDRHLQSFIKHHEKPGKIISFLFAVVNRYIHHNGSTLAASISYYIFLSLFPILMLSVAFMGYITQDYGTYYYIIIDTVEQVMPGYSGIVEKNLTSLINQSAGLSFFALAGLIWISLGVFSSLEFALNTIMEVKEYKSFLERGLLSVGFVFFLVVFILASSFLTPLKSLFMYVFSQLPYFSFDREAIVGGLNFGLTLLPFFISYMLFNTIYKLIPARKLSQQTVVIGGVLAAFFWEAAKSILIWYISARLSYYQLVYGSLALTIITILWSYFFSVILLIVACVIVELENYLPQENSVK